MSFKNIGQQRKKSRVSLNFFDRLKYDEFEKPHLFHLFFTVPQREAMLAAARVDRRGEIEVVTRQFTCLFLFQPTKRKCSKWPSLDSTWSAPPSGSQRLERYVAVTPRTKLAGVSQLKVQFVRYRCNFIYKCSENDDALLAEFGF